MTQTPPITDNQRILLEAITTLDGPTTSYLAQLPKASGDPFGPDAARSALKRMEERGWLLGSGAGGERAWAATSAGRELIGYAADQDESSIRRYVVLEEVKLEDLDDLPDGTIVYLPVATPEARNTEHAYRQAAKQRYGAVDGSGEPTLVAVASRMWQPTTVRIHTRQTVSVG